MNKAGRKPKPTQLKRLEGNPGKRQLPDNEPKPDSSMPECPWWLDYFGRKEWQRVCPELHRLGLLSSIDASALAGYCAAYSRWVKAEKELNKGFTYEYIDVDFKLKRTKKPEVAIARDALNQVRQFCAEFGLTPSARSRMVLPRQSKKDPFEEMLDEFNKEQANK